MPEALKPLRLFDTLSVVALAASLLFAGWKQFGASPDNSKPEWSGAPTDTEIAHGSIQVGPPRAALTIVEFSDFQCPYCRQAAVTLDSLFKRYPEQIRFVYRHMTLHGRSFSAALGAECAHRQGRFLPMHDSLFTQSRLLDSKSAVTIAAEVGGIDSAAFSRCLSNEGTERVVATDTSLAIKLKLSGTPTFIVGNRKFVGNPGMAVWDSIAIRHGLLARR